MSDASAAPFGDERIPPEVTDGANGAPSPLRPPYVLGTIQIAQPLVAGPRGRLQALPFGYDTVVREWFDLFPERPSPRDWTHWTSPGMTANSQCLECHVTDFRKGYDPGTDAYGTRWLELGVGCEACHGPGARHVQQRDAGATDAYGHEASSMDTCAPCHSRRTPIADGWLPGRPLADYFDFELLDGDVFHEDGHVADEAYEWTSFQMTRMATAGVRCGDCHEPHGTVLRADGDALCLRCHARDLAEPAHTHHTPETAGSRCVDCHMPEAVFMERDRRRDHFIAAPDPVLAEAIGGSDACTTCHRDESRAWAADWVSHWYGPGPRVVDARARATAIHLARRGDPSAVPGLLAILADNVDIVRRASAARLLGPWASEVSVRDALVAATGDPADVVRAGAVASLGEVVTRDEVVRQTVVGATRDRVRWVRSEAGFALRAAAEDAVVKADREAVHTAVEEWVETQAVLADFPESSFNLGLFWMARGDLVRAEQAYRRSLALWPWDPAPRHHLAMVLAATDRRNEAEEAWRKVLTDHPDWPPAAFALGVFYAEDGRSSESIAQLEGCLRVDPTFPRAVYQLALAYRRAGDLVRAESAFEAAASDPTSRSEALRELVRMAIASGDRQAQQRWLPEALAADPVIGQDPRLREALER